MIDKLKLANELASRKVDSDCGENLAIYVPFDDETRAILSKLGYSENEKFPVFDDLIDITFVANDIFPDGDHWCFDGEKFSILFRGAKQKEEGGMKAIYGDICMKDRLEDIRIMIPVVQENIETIYDILNGGSKQTDYSEWQTRTLCEGHALFELLGDRLAVFEKSLQVVSAWEKQNKCLVEQEIENRKKG